MSARSVGRTPTPSSGDRDSTRGGKHEPERRRWRPHHLLPSAMTLGPLRSHSSPPSPQQLGNSPAGSPVPVLQSVEAWALPSQC